MTLLGVGLLIWIYKFKRSQRAESAPDVRPVPARQATWTQRISFMILVSIPLVIPSDWTQDVPERYGSRHEGLEHSAIYPRIPETTDEAEDIIRE